MQLLSFSDAHIEETVGLLVLGKNEYNVILLKRIKNLLI